MAACNQVVEPPVATLVSLHVTTTHAKMADVSRLDPIRMIVNAILDGRVPTVIGKQMSVCQILAKMEGRVLID